MQHRASALSTLAVAAILIGCGSALAAPTTYVSGTGTNTGLCPITAPCATFQYAHTNTDAGGTIIVVSTGSYGGVWINKSISIIAADGVQALIRTTTTAAGCSGAGICVAAGATDVVYLRGIIIDLNLASAQGINYAFGGALHVQNCVIRRISGGGNAGIAFSPSQSDGELYVTDTTIANTPNGIVVSPRVAVSSKATIDRVHIENLTGYGIVFDGLTYSGSHPISGIIRDTVVSKAGLNGIMANNNTSGGSVDVSIDRSAVFNTAVGLRAFNVGANMRVGNSMITGNATLMNIQAGALISLYSTNMTEGNGNDVVTPLGTRPFRGDRGQ